MELNARERNLDFLVYYGKTSSRRSTTSHRVQQVDRLLNAIFFLIFLPVKSLAHEVYSDQITQSIIFNSDGKISDYSGVLGDRDGFYRGLTTVNGQPALFSLGRDDYLFTLVIRDGSLVIDCMYADTRNNMNGARVTVGRCGLERPLKPEFDDEIQLFANEMKESIYGFDTKAVGNNVQRDFLLGNIEDIFVYDRYYSAEDLENAAPRKFIRAGQGCFFFDDDVVFTISSKREASMLYLDVRKSEDPTIFQRLGVEALRALAVNSCDAQ